MIATESNANANAPHDGKSLARQPPMRQQCPRGADERRDAGAAVGTRINTRVRADYLYRSLLRSLGK